MSCSIPKPRAELAASLKEATGPRARDAMKGVWSPSLQTCASQAEKQGWGHLDGGSPEDHTPSTIPHVEGHQELLQEVPTPPPFGFTGKPRPDSKSASSSLGGC